MAVLQLQIEIDSDVQPELHAVVASMARSPARAERVRQLAAAGLIWEHVRAQGRPKAGPAQTARTEPAAPLMATRGQAIDADSAIDLDGESPTPVAASDVPVLWDAVEDTAALAHTGARVAETTVQSAVRRTANSDVAVPPRRAGAKPRLLRMKEMGLFQNGPDG